MWCSLAGGAASRPGLRGQGSAGREARARLGRCRGSRPSAGAAGPERCPPARHATTRARRSGSCPPGHTNSSPPAYKGRQPAMRRTALPEREWSSSWNRAAAGPPCQERTRTDFLRVRLFSATEKPLPDEAEMGAANDLQRHDSRWWRGGVKVEVIADVLGVLVKGPVGLEIAAGAQRAELEDGLGTAQSPAGAGDVHAVLDQR